MDKVLKVLLFNMSVRLTCHRIFKVRHVETPKKFFKTSLVGVDTPKNLENPNQNMESQGFAFRSVQQPMRVISPLPDPTSIQRIEPVSDQLRADDRPGVSQRERVIPCYDHS